MIRILFGRDKKRIADLQLEVADLKRERADLHYALGGNTVELFVVAASILNEDGRHPDIVHLLTVRRAVIQNARNRWVKKSEWGR